MAIKELKRERQHYKLQESDSLELQTIDIWRSPDLNQEGLWIMSVKPELSCPSAEQDLVLYMAARGEILR